MNDDFAPFELSVKLKEKGLPQDDFIGYDEFGALCIGDEHSIVCASPTISQVLKWLREEKGLHIEILHIFSEKTLWDFEVTHIGSYERWWSNLELFDTYEQAAIAGIEYVLDNLI